jgi:hypothetical protein
MKTITFTYTKDDSSTSERVLVVSNEPTKNVSGTDISGLSVVDQGNYIQAAKDLREAYLESLKQLNDIFGTTHSYRQFKPTGMSDIVEIK